MRTPLPKKEDKLLLQISIPARLKDEVLRICKDREISLSAAAEWGFEEFVAEAKSGRAK